MKPKPHAHDEALAAALGFAVRKRLAGTAGDLTTDTLVAWVRAGGCPDSEWRGNRTRTALGKWMPLSLAGCSGMGN